MQDGSFLCVRIVLVENGVHRGRSRLFWRRPVEWTVASPTGNRSFPETRAYRPTFGKGDFQFLYEWPEGMCKAMFVVTDAERGTLASVLGAKDCVRLGWASVQRCSAAETGLAVMVTTTPLLAWLDKASFGSWKAWNWYSNRSHSFTNYHMGPLSTPCLHCMFSLSSINHRYIFLVHNDLCIYLAY